MSLIEEAAKRLEQLKNAGVDLGEEDVLSSPGNPAEAEARTPMPEALSRGREPKERPQGSPQVLRRPAPETAAPHREAEHSRKIAIDLAHLAAAGMVTPDAPRSQIADEFRIIKRPLLSNAQRTSPAAGASPNLIMVTSALTEEGKTFISVNLAMSIAMELDNTVLLVDADVANPTLPSIFRFEGSKGLLDVLNDPAIRLSDVLLRTNVPRLSVLPAGTAHRRATELLASEAMERLVDEMANRYDDRVVIFDAPPLLPTTESRALATHMGQIVLVVEADKTTHGTLKSALSTIEACPIIMKVLNKASRSDVGSYYGYRGYG